MPVDGPLYDTIRVVLLLGMALLAWREFRGIRARMKADKEREAQTKRDTSDPPVS